MGVQVKRMRRGREYSRYRRRRRGKRVAIALGVFLGTLLLFAILLLSVHISEIEVTGNKQYTKEQIIDLVFGGNWSRTSA